MFWAIGHHVTQFQGHILRAAPNNRADMSRRADMPLLTLHTTSDLLVIN